MSGLALEWRLFLAGLVLVALLVALALGGWAVARLTDDPQSPFELTTRCLRVEKGLEVGPVGRDAIASSADDGALRTVVETNAVTLVMWRTEEAAARGAAAYRAVGVDPTILERRGRTAYLWDAPPTLSQRQTMYDCEY